MLKELLVLLVMALSVGTASAMNQNINLKSQTSTLKSESLSLPPNTEEGFLGNGLRYIIKRNTVPRHTIECRLVMHVGSVNEDESQHGAAHFLEHMAFNGSSHFPGGSLVDYFERQGMKYGRDINAYTGFDRTVYWYTLPVDSHSHDIIDTTLVAMGDILSSLTIDSLRTTRERGIILEELRDYDTHDEFYNLKIGADTYAHHVPLGTASEIAAISRRTLLSFYRRWYSPENATVIVVGDVDIDGIKAKIERYLGGITVTPDNESWGGLLPHTYAPGIHLMTISDSLVAQTKVDLMIPHEAVLTRTVDDVVRKQRGDMLVRMLSWRLKAQVFRTDVADTWYLADKSFLSFVAEDDTVADIMRNITAISTVLKSIAKYGPAKDELDYCRSYQSVRLKTELYEHTSAEWCDDFIDRAILGDCRVYSDDDLEMIRRQLMKTKAKDIRALAQSILTDDNRQSDMANHMPTMLAAVKQGLSTSDSITEADIATAWNNGISERHYHFTLPDGRTSATDEEAVVQHKIDNPVLTAVHPFVEDSVLSRWHYDDIGVDEVRLANGITILMRPTTGGDSTVTVTAFGRGGLGDIPDSLYWRLADVVSYVDMGGIASVPADTLGRIMADNGMMLTIGIGNYWHQAMATAKGCDVQPMLNLLYEKLTNPGKDSTGFAESKAEELESFGKETLLSKMMRRDYSRVVNNTVDSIVGNILPAQNHVATRHDIESLSLDSLTSFYKQVFGNPLGLTLIVTGRFSPDSIAPMIASTFARMKAKSIANSIADGHTGRTLQSEVNVDRQPTTNDRHPTTDYRQPTTYRFPSSDSTKTSCSLLFVGSYKPSLKNTLMFKLMRDIMQSRLLSVMRERDNIVYSPFAETQYQGVPQGRVWFRLYIDVKNENYRRMLNDMKEIVDSLHATPVTMRELDKMRRSFIVTRRQSLTDDAPMEWRTALTGLVENGESLKDYDCYEDVLYSITPDDIMKAFREYIDRDKMILLVSSDDKK